MPPTLPPVLYVEDEENDAFLMAMAFERAGVRHPLRVLVDGQEAIDYVTVAGTGADLGRHPLPAVVLLDLNLPRVHGLEVLRRIRTDERLKSLPVVVFTSSEQPSDRSRAQELGASDYIVKPTQLDRFVEVAAALKRTWLE